MAANTFILNIELVVDTGNGNINVSKNIQQRRDESDDDFMKRASVVMGFLRKVWSGKTHE